jgi:U-box domain-containing protein 5
LDGSCISRENYSVENLLSSDEELRKRGFLCETFIRPPISLTVCFSFSFDIKYVVIGTRVGGQKSSGFQLSAGRNNNVLRICSMITEKDTIVFHDNNTDLSSFGNNYDKCCFNISASRSIRSAEMLSVRIFKTVNSIPAISKLEVWGKISCNVSLQTRQIITLKWEESKKPKAKQVEIINNQQIIEKNPDNFKICEDFLDSITYEIMNYPMVLPCGKYVDRSTIEKCFEHDATYGRTPCDPFTGIPFTDTLKPIFVPELKGRIDSFLIKHVDNENIKCLPRTVGKRSFSFYTERQTKLAKLQCSTCYENSNLYSLPCKHLQCRNCLKAENNQCNICHRNFNRSQVNKYHENH